MCRQEVACGVLYNSQGKILMGLRTSDSEDGGFWEFPGGKREQDETIQHCLQREWKEELNLTIYIDRELYSCTMGDKYMCRFFIGKILDEEKIKRNVHEKIVFVDKTEMATLNMFQSDKQLLNII